MVLPSGKMNVNTNGTMKAVPTPGGPDKVTVSPKGSSGKMLHDMGTAAGGAERVEPKATASSKGEWTKPGGAQQIRPA